MSARLKQSGFVLIHSSYFQYVPYVAPSESQTAAHTMNRHSNRFSTGCSCRAKYQPNEWRKTNDSNQFYQNEFVFGNHLLANQLVVFDGNGRKTLFPFVCSSFIGICWCVCVYGMLKVLQAFLNFLFIVNKCMYLCTTEAEFIRAGIYDYWLKYSLLAVRVLFVEANINNAKADTTHMCIKVFCSEKRQETNVGALPYNRLMWIHLLDSLRLTLS